MKLRFNTVGEYVNYFAALVNKEREAQKEFHLKEIETLSPQERQRRGRAILGLKFRKAGKSPTGFYLLKLFLGDKPLPKNEFQVGDWVLLTQQHKPTEKSPQGVVYEISKYHLVLGFSEGPPRLRKRQAVRVDLFVNEITFTRMKDALFSFKREGHPLADFILGRNVPQQSKFEVQEIENLNFSQREAVSLSLLSEDIAIIHGPPGTGKTTTLSYYIKEEVLRGKRILAVADSNNAVDNLMEKLLELGVKVIRVGNPIKIDTKLQEHTLDNKIRENKNYKFIEKEEKQLQLLLEERNKCLKPTQAMRRGYSDEAIIELAKAGKYARGLTPRQLKRMANWIKLNREVKDIINNIRSLELQIKMEELGKAEVVCATNSGSALVEMKFDVCVLDEATQSTEPSSLIPIMKSRKVVLAGDDKQLPPTVIDFSIQDKLGFSLFERWHKLYSDRSRMLRVQYRMHPNIVEFPNNMFYDGKLQTAEIIKSRDFPYNIYDARDGRHYEVFSREYNVVFIETPDNSREGRGRFEYSYYNEWEANYIRELITTLGMNEIPLSEVGVISPYDAQVSLLRSYIKEEDLDIKTIDGFQGREKEIIIISLVRNNPEGNIGFLRDYRRLNVAITRPRTKLIIIGNSRTIKKDNLYAEWYKHISHSGLILKN